MAEAKKPANKPEQSSSTKFSQEALGKDAAKIIDRLNNVVKQTSVDDLLGTNFLINDSSLDEKNQAKESSSKLEIELETALEEAKSLETSINKTPSTVQEALEAYTKENLSDNTSGNMGICPAEEVGEKICSSKIQGFLDNMRSTVDDNTKVQGVDNLESNETHFLAANDNQ